MNRIVLVGAGMLGINVLNILQRRDDFEVVGFVDSIPEESLFGVPVLGGDDVLPSLRDSVDSVAVCLGNPAIRRKVAEKVLGLGFSTPAIISPMADICPGAEVGEGSIIFASVYLGPYASVGRFSLMEGSSQFAPGASIPEFSTVHPLTRVSAGE